MISDGRDPPGMDTLTLEDIFSFRLAGDTTATAGQPSEQEFSAIAKAGYEVVINLGLHDAPYALPNEPLLVESLGMKYLHIPVDFSQPEMSDLQNFFDAMASNEGRRVFIHCAANKRVTAFLGLYRVIKLNWGPERAFELMHEIWKPNHVWERFIRDALQK